MNIIQQAQAKRESLQRELARIEAFLATAYELQQEMDQSGRPDPVSDAVKADAPIQKLRAPNSGSGSATLQAVVEVLKEQGRPLAIRELLPLVLAKGIEVGGKSPLATLSARISQKGVVEVREGQWWFIDDPQRIRGLSGNEKATGIPSKETPAASLFTTNERNS